MASGRRTNAAAEGDGHLHVEELKREAALSSTYQRGTNLANNGAVHAMVVYESSQLAQMAAWVHGSDGYYRVAVLLNTALGKVISHTCECEAHANYEGMCKHTIALALTYLASRTEVGRKEVPYPESFSLVDSPPLQPPSIPYYISRPPKTRKAAAARYARSVAPQKKPAPKTSPQISNLINTYADQALDDTRRLARSTQPALEASEIPVDLQCIVTSANVAWRYSWSNDTWALGLKVVRGKVSYVVKSLSDLVDAWHEGATFTYGKSLSFCHRPESFTPRANQLLELLSGVVEAQQSLYAAQENRSYSYSSYDYQRRMSAKTLPLSTAQLFEVLRIEVGQKVTVEMQSPGRSGYSVTERRVATVMEGNPSPSVQLEQGEDVWRLTVKPDRLLAIGDERGLAIVDLKELYLCSSEFSHDLGVFFSTLLPMRDPLSIRDTDMPAFCAAVLPALRTHVELDAPDDVEGYLPPAAEISFHIGLNEGAISCHAVVSYGEQSLGLYDDVYEQQPVRDVEHEMLAQRLLAAFFPNGDHDTPNYGSPYAGGSRRGEVRRRWGYYQTYVDPWFDKDDDASYYLLFSEGLEALSQLGEVYLDERLRHVTVRQAPSVEVSASVHGGLLDLSVSSDDLEPAELMAYLASYRRRQRFVRLTNGDIVRLDGSIAAVEGLADGLGVDAAQLVEGIDDLPANRTLFVDAMLKRGEGVAFSRNDAFRQIVRDFETVADADYEVPATIRAKLRPYQREGFRWLCTLGGVGFGGILADDMGLGKTLQAIAYLAHARDQRGAAGEEGALPSLVVCPASLVYNWAAELERFCPSMDVVVVAGPKRSRTSAIAAAVDTDVLITSYDLMKRDVEAYERERFHAVILDEAHYIKNANTIVARAAKRLPAEFRLALTGTPIENRLSELWSIFDFLMPGVLGSHDSFAKRFSTPIGSGDQGAAERLRKLVSPFVLRRLKRDVLHDLPEKNESVVSSSLEGEQGKLYRAHAQRLRMQVEKQLPEEFAGMRLQILAELTKLRQICCDPALAFDDYRGGSAKLDTCMELVASALDGGHQLLLFSQFTSMLDLIAARLDAEKVGYFTLTGATSKEQRQRLVARFQAGERPVFLISLKAGGVGLNLTAADIVIHYDPWWNVAAEDQATDRTHRIGQMREVSVFKLIAKDTIEEKIVQMQEAKRALADAVIGGEGISSTSLTRDDLLALLEA